MPSKSAAQHRWIGAMHSHPDEAKKAGLSPSKVQEWLHADRGSPWKRDGGGSLPDYSGGITGPTPTPQTQSPLVQGMIQRYSSMPDEKLQELAARLGGSQQGQMIQQLLMRRHMMPQTAPLPDQQQQPAQQPASPLSQPLRKGGKVKRVEGGSVPYGDPRWTPRYSKQELAGSALQGLVESAEDDDDVGDLRDSLRYHGFHVPQILRAKGGSIPKRDGGGGLNLGEMSPWWTRREATGADSGFLHGSTPGRADQVKTQALPGSYVIPADVVAGLGEGNSLAGAKAIQEAIASGPWGTPLPRMRGRSTIPHPPSLPANERSTYKAGGQVPIFEAKERSKGGANTGNTPVDLSDGEFVVSPKDCERFGNGDRSAGHRWWDDWVLRKRKDHIEKLKKLPPPVKP